MPENIKILTDLKRLKQATETISDVQLLIDNNRFRSAVNRIYYAMIESYIKVD